MERGALKVFIEACGTEYSEVLGINLKNGNDAEIFKWFLASLLFGAPITENAVIKTYNCFKKHNVLTPKKIIETGWDGLVKILDEGNYTRYDFKTADKLLEVMKNLLSDYSGSLSLLNERAYDAQDLEHKLKSLGKGIGNVTVSIFLRELRYVWEKARPKPTSLVVLAAKKLDLIKEETQEAALQQLEEYWKRNKIEGKSFINFETALVRLGKDFCRKRKCTACSVKSLCLAPEAP